MMKDKDTVSLEPGSRSDFLITGVLFMTILYLIFSGFSSSGFSVYESILYGLFLWVGVWVAILFICDSYFGFCRKHLDEFQTHIYQCVGEGRCPAKEIATHRIREKFVYWCMKKFGSKGALFTFRVTLLLAMIFSPIIFLAKGITNRWLI